MLGKNEISTEGSRAGNYNKRAIPFDLSNDQHVRGLATICALFANPWEISNYTRGDLATDVSDFFIAVGEGRVVVMPAERYAELTAEPKTPSKKKGK